MTSATDQVVLSDIKHLGSHSLLRTALGGHSETVVVGSPQWDKEMLVRGQTSCDNQYTCSSLTIEEFSEGTMDLLILIGTQAI